MRLIDADALGKEMYRKSFETDDGRQHWNSGLWIRYKIFEEALRDAPTVDSIPVIWLMKHSMTAQSDDACEMINEIIARWRIK